MSKYLITLTPAGKFFFGGDMTFSVEGDGKHNEDFSSYIIESNKFPQQTSLLGMLRFLILRNDGIAFDDATQKIKDKGRAKELIGGESFSVKESHTENSFGKIGSLSFCFLRKDGSNYFQLPLDNGMQVTFGNQKGYLNGIEVSIPDIPDYDSKKGTEHRYSDGVTTFEEDDIFEKDQRIGINRDIKNGKTEDDALFKQISYRLKENFCFAFTAEVDTDLTAYNKQIVSMGGDSSQFIFHAEKTECEPKLPLSDKIVLSSPAYLTQDEYSKACFAITETVAFRFLETSVNTESYNVLNKNITRSNKYNLYATGSVFYFNDDAKKDDFKEALEGKKEFRQIGYNQYQ